MRFTKKFPINLSPKYLAMLMLGGASLFASCDKEDEPMHDVELQYYEDKRYYNFDDVSIENIQRHIDNSRVANIYIKITENSDHRHYKPENVMDLLSYLKYRIDMSPKVKGRGNFKFTPGVVEESDSLYFVSQGWTINKHLQKQK